jgi:hypothetical protein
MLRAFASLIITAIVVALGGREVAAFGLVVGMAGTNTAIFDGAMKTVFENEVAEMVNNSFHWQSWFKAEKAEYYGQDTVYSAHVKRNVSPMWCGEDGAFADAGAQQNIKVHVGQRKIMARVRMTSEVMHDTSKNEGAWKSARKSEMSELINDLARMEEYSFTSDGRGVLALIDDASPSGSATMTVDAPGGIVGDDFGNRFFLVDMFVAAVDPSTGSLRSGIRKVTACSSDGTSLTFDSAPPAAWADNDYLVQAANSSVTSIVDTSYEQAAWGLTALFDDGTYRMNYFNVPRDLYPQYSSYVKASTGALSEDVIYQGADVIDQKLGGTISTLTMHNSVRRVINQFHLGDRRYATESTLMNPDPGTRVVTQGQISFGGVPIEAIRTHPLAMIFGIDLKGAECVRYVSEPGKWVDEDGRVLVRAGVGSTARDSFEAWYRKRYQNHVRKPGKAFRLDGITGQTLIVQREAGS